MGRSRPMKKLKGFLAGLCLVCMAVPAMAVEFGDDFYGGVTLHGFISQGYLKSDNNNFFARTSDGSTRFNEFGINVSSQVSDKLRVGIQIFARNLGEFGSGDPEIDWGFADYRWKDWAGIRFGKMKLIHGLYNTTRDIDMLRNSIFLPQSVYNEAWRDTVAAISGAEVYGDIYMGRAGSLAYQFQGGETDFPVDGGVVTSTKDQSLLKRILATPESTHTKYAYTGGLVWNTPLNGLRLSTTAWVVEFDTDGGFYQMDQKWNAKVRTTTNSKVNTASLEYIRGPFTFVTEYMAASYEFNTLGKSGDAVFVNIINSQKKVDLDTEGYYAALAYRFTDWLEVGLSYSEYYADKDDKDGKNNLPVYSNNVQVNPRYAAGYREHDAWLKDTALTFRFDVTENWVFKLEGHAMNGAAILMKDTNSDTDGKVNTSENWFLVAGKMTVSF